MSDQGNSESRVLEDQSSSSISLSLSRSGVLMDTRPSFETMENFDDIHIEDDNR